MWNKLGGTDEIGLAENIRQKTESEQKGREKAEALNNATQEVRNRLRDEVSGKLDSDPIAKAAFNATIKKD